MNRLGSPIATSSVLYSKKRLYMRNSFITIPLVLNKLSPPVTGFVVMVFSKFILWESHFGSIHETFLATVQVLVYEFRT